MRVSDAFSAFVIAQLEDLGDLTPRPMFGGVGLYHRGVFFGLLAADRLYFKTGPGNRADYTRKRMEAFAPYGNAGRRSTSYFAVPIGIVESSVELVAWARKAVAAARK